MLSNKRPESSLLLNPVVNASVAAGMPIDELLVRSGLSASVLNSPTAIGTGECKKVWEKAAADLGSQDFGVHVGQAIAPGTYDIISFIVATSTTLREAMTSWSTLIRRLTLRGSFSLKEEGNVASFESDWGSTPICERSPQVGAYLLSSMFTYSRIFIGDKWDALETRIGSPLPNGAEYALAQRTDSKLVHTPGSHGIVFERGMLDEKLHTANPSLNRILRRSIEFGYFPESPKSESTTTTSQISEIMRHAIEHGGCFPGIESVSRELGVQPRTLQRRLTEESTSFRELTETIRRHIATKLIRTSNETIAQIGERLGYSSAGTFSRAYRSWNGGSPSTARETSKID